MLLEHIRLILVMKMAMESQIMNPKNSSIVRDQLILEIRMELILKRMNERNSVVIENSIKPSRVDEIVPLVKYPESTDLME